ncbi:HNH endonuclease [Actinoalloteichus fjordicus]|uniref:Restriction endonuclease n=1 Tax=Actinoalloteichus fjordicus TaxID=1612552 RepID=A0AAC9L949_9PSEU|nr:restriction endonuclease [Actinoalloteichus fjordicus]APU19599.1 restriction endonuclease [Actinoalloteichus sp. GBA129-24]
MPDRQPTSIGAPAEWAPTAVVRPANARLCSPSIVRADPTPSAQAVPAGETPSPWARRQVLLLNATYEPLAALPLRRAVVLVICGKAEVVHDDPQGLAVHSVNASQSVPSVIRLSRFVRVPYRGRVPLTRAALMLRDRYRCAYCRGRAETVDHVVPRSRGGSHSWENCVASCARCNHRKADRLLRELGWRLLTIPRAPSGPYWRLLAGGETDPLWLPYLGEPAA